MSNAIKNKAERELSQDNNIVTTARTTDEKRGNAQRRSDISA